MSKKLLSLALLVLALSACVRPQTGMDQMYVPVEGDGPTPGVISTRAQQADPGAAPVIPTLRPPNTFIASPTPDAPHPVPTLRASTAHYTIRPGDTLAVVARNYGVDVTTIAEANGIADPNLLKIGLQLVIPPPSPKSQAPDFKIIPDSELVLSPNTVNFNLVKFIEVKASYLDNYREEIDGETFSGAQIVDRVSREHSVNPRILLALLEMQSSWVTQRNSPPDRVDYPLGFFDRSRKGLYKQLFWAANNLNRGYYGWKNAIFPAFILADNSVARVAPQVNAGTAAVQYVLGLLFGRSDWLAAVSPDGLYATYYRLFGYPFDYTFDPILPDDLSQPAMQLPFEKGIMWYFTGGPHMGWDDGSAPAALDFAPQDAGACNVSSDWEVAVAGGVIARSGNGEVVLDLDGDGNEQTGWTLLYLHVASQDRVAAGTIVKAGAHIGHPSCEGGFALATHLHLARRYNGEWIPAGGPLPFTLDGWTAESTGVEYDGYLKKNGAVVEAWDGRKDENQIQR